MPQVAAVGIRAKRWITYHGIALNVSLDMAPYKDIIPCGLDSKPVTSISQLLSEAEDSGTTRYRPPKGQQLTEAAAAAMVDSFADVFGVQYVTDPSKS
mmetsp:Transcript_2840/g.6861  ORF Transcript_2840/g.6861 Transcript_2840/m.6861 type:complete len:98 (-) Transcript_2840:342-635(-)